MIQEDKSSGSSGRKLPPELENPVDNILLYVCSAIHPYFKAIGFTANGITIFSGLLQVMSIILIWQGLFATASIMYMVGYALDVLDGYYARTYNMVSEYGDILDHTKDTIVVVGLHMAIIFHPMIPFFMWKVTFLTLSFILSICTAMYLGCQESYYYQRWSNKRQESPFLAPFRKLLCSSTNNDLLERRLKSLRWGGTGTTAAFYAAFLLAVAVVLLRPRHTQFF